WASQTVRQAERKGIGVVRIGTKNFTEQLILGELLAQLIEAHTPLRVERKFNLGGTVICHQALVRGDIDLYPEYTGTALTAILRMPTHGEPDEVLSIVRREYRLKFQCEWLEPFGFNNTYAIAVRRSDAEKRGWKKISDLKPIAKNLRAGFTPEFRERPDGYIGLKRVYGFEFGRVVDMDPALMYQALARGKVDVICAFATDGRIPAYNLLLLEDDRKFFPPYHAAPVIRAEVLQTFPELRQVLNLLAGAINNETMQRLNYEVDENKRSTKEVVREFLAKMGL
ncbi:MAG: glycine betaine ABC transporter substrate-binding protein, partial [Armatimonadota bacterium]